MRWLPTCHALIAGIMRDTESYVFPDAARLPFSMVPSGKLQTAKLAEVL